jgi:glycosyltransferase involved in cell wall biosynthesis
MPEGAAETEDVRVSVVTPVYNGEEYLEECINSVLAQTHANWVYTIVDNASTDATPRIVERYARLDPRIEHRRFAEFVPATVNLNRAVRAVDPTSRWTKTLMADDWLYPECLERMVKAGEQSPSIGLVTGYERWGDRVFHTQVPYDETVFSGRAIVARNLFSGENVTGGPTAQMYRTDAILKEWPFYDAGLEFNDTDAAFRTLLDADLGFVHQVVTYERQQGGTRIGTSYRMGATLAEHLLFIARYGPSVLDGARYRSALRRQIRMATFWHLKQSIRPSRLRESEFFEYHERLVGYLREANVDHDRELQAYTRLVGALLARRRLDRLRRSRRSRAS